jgi:Tol biopolymer transport system component
MLRLLGAALLCALLVAQASQAADERRIFLPAVSAPFREIVFDSWYLPPFSLRPAGRIYTARSDGSGLRMLSGSEGSSDSVPAWSPRGDRIAFLSTREITSQIYLMRPDGAGQTRLTSLQSGVWTRPRWSPDGSRIAFLSSAWGALSVIGADGSGLRTLTASGVGQFEWTRDGAGLLFTAWDSTSSKGRVALVRLDGTQPVEATLFSSDRPIEEALWSPDGTRIALTIPQEPTYEHTAFLIGPDGGNLRKLPVAEGVYGLAWSPDGAQLAVAGRTALHLLDRDGAQQRQIFAVPADRADMSPASPAWSPDGSRIMVMLVKPISPGTRIPWREPWVVDLNGAGGVVPLGEHMPGLAAWRP